MLLSLNLLSQNSRLDLKEHYYYIWKIEGGSTIVGKYAQQDEYYYYIETSDKDKFQILKRNVKSIEFINDKKFNFYFEYPDGIEFQYITLPTALPPQKGASYFQNTLLIHNSFSHAITNNITFGVNYSFAAEDLIGKANNFNFTTVYRAKLLNNLYLGGGGFWGVRTKDDEEESVGKIFLMATYASDGKDFTLGYGHTYKNYKLAPNPTLSFSSYIRLGRNLSFITENWLINHFNHTELISNTGFRYSFNRKSHVTITGYSNETIRDEIGRMVPVLSFNAKF